VAKLIWQRPYLTLPYLTYGAGLRPALRPLGKGHIDFKYPALAVGGFGPTSNTVFLGTPQYPFWTGPQCVEQFCFCSVQLCDKQTDKQYTTGSQVTLAHIWRIQCNL